MLKRLRSLFRAFLHRRAFEAGMADELSFHIRQYTEDLIRSGVPAEQAARCARIEFGGWNSIQEDCRSARGLSLFDDLARALRYAARSLGKTPAFTATAASTLALCLGSNLAIFAVLDSIVLRPLPFPQADRLVTIFNTYPKAGVERDGATLTNYYERRGRIAAFSSLALYRQGTAIVGEPGVSRREQVTQVSPDFFSTLGRGPILGRSFDEEETSYRANNVAVIANTYWRSRFNADPQIIGRQMRVDGRSVTVVGVLPFGFRFLSSEAQVYLPLASRPEDRAPSERHSGGNVTQMIARMRAGASLEQAQAQIDAQNTALAPSYPQAKMMAEAGFRSLVVPLHADHVASIRPTLLLLQASVFVLLLLGGVNVVNLLLIRSSTRSRELAVRQALGASRLHIIGEIVVETTLLTLSGAFLGLAIAAGGIRFLAALGTDRLPLGAHVHFDLPTAGLGLSAAVVIGLVLAAPVAWFHLRHHPGESLQLGSRGSTAGRAAQTVRHGFIVAQVALAFVLLTGAGLLGISLKHAASVSPGFRADNLISGQISFVGNKYPRVSSALAFDQKLLDQLSHRLGLLSVGMVTNLPFSGKDGKSAAKIKGRVLRPGESPRGHYSFGVDGDYFRAMGFSLREGRFLEASDSNRSGRVCVVDEDFARYYWPHGGALGQRLFQGSEEGPESEAFTIVGVVGSVKQSTLTEDAGQGSIYYPYFYRPDYNVFVVARATLHPQSIKTMLQEAVRRIDPDLPINNLQSMDTRIADTLLVRRSPALLAALFSVVALLLTAVGTYGVLSYAVSQRRREIGVRIALGARPENIRRQFLHLALRLLVSGTSLGVVGAWAMGSAMRSVLFQVPAFPFEILAGVGCIIGFVALIACFLPAYRASRISPMQVLSQE